MSGVRVFCAFPAFGNRTTSYTTASLVATAVALTCKGMWGGLGQMSYPDIGDLRSIFLSIWHEKMPECTHILFVDADMQWEPELVIDMIESDLPLTGCLYTKRRNPPEFVHSGLRTPDEIKNGFLKVEGIGFGVALIRRDCVDAMIAGGHTEVETDMTRHGAAKFLAEQGVTRMIRAFDKVELPERRLSEDLSFCHRHRASGGDVWVAINHTVEHIGDHAYAGKFVSNAVESSAPHETAIA